MNIPNKINLDNQTGLEPAVDLFETVFNLISREEKLPSGSFVNLLLTDDGRIRELNHKYLGRDELTDVISFEADLPGVPLLGDIIIDTTVADNQKGTNPLNLELQMLFLHGMLHLLGYDHLSAAQAKLMRMKEDKYLNALKEYSKTSE